jgi:serine/threonine protein kinase
VPTIVRPAEGDAGIGERIGKYEVIREVGRGSTGTVYLSHDPYYGRDVAIKAYRIAGDDDPARAKVARKMFLSEAHMVGMLQHPNIMPIYDAGRRTATTTSSPSSSTARARSPPTRGRTTCCRWTTC